jgi:hypothetical protein
VSEGETGAAANAYSIRKNERVKKITVKSCMIWPHEPNNQVQSTKNFFALHRCDWFTEKNHGLNFLYSPGAALRINSIVHNFTGRVASD